MQSLSPQQSLQPTLQTLEEGSKSKRSKHQTQILLKEENIYREQEFLSISYKILYSSQERGFLIPI